ncbi:Rpn family recombination-promoting nuclease/putative transposase [Microcystis aeruginosa]|uniref:Rpn family recombination-promoting nuclease/putative transposase n=1 Tax=Microcystis aeruginosa TaxID=1126 RepID=UPI0029304787|nr:Rpn family recombination-promoting nuclease/putative transposase [Microcystis aeruginosa]WOB68819.1 Rpn family recombination-promoting nuclease/putative transposase [Microcystis aeruginosa LE3]
MKTDSIFYRMFLDFPDSFFELIERPDAIVSNYRFTSQEVKQLAFRLDGLFLPLDNLENLPFYLVEVQFQKDEDLYYRLFSELFLYLRQYKPLSPWQIVVIYPSREIEREHPQQFADFLSLARVKRIYLDELPNDETPSLAIALIKLVTESESQAVNSAKILIKQAQREVSDRLVQRNVIDLIETIIIYKLPQKSREEIEAMLELQDLKQTRFYQEAFGDGIERGIEQGIEQGINLQKLKTIPLLQDLGLTPQQISERLDLNLETVLNYLTQQQQ